jgi:anti-sigma28 factor (negative regulator of flagellin synthesis)
MDKIDELIKTLTSFKEELSKNVNQSYAPAPNMSKEEMDKASKDPALAPKEVKIKQLQSQIDAGKYKVPASKIADKMLKEELTCSENGQWNIKKMKY